MSVGLRFLMNMVAKLQNQFEFNTGCMLAKSLLVEIRLVFPTGNQVCAIHYVTNEALIDSSLGLNNIFIYLSGRIDCSKKEYLYFSDLSRPSKSIISSLTSSSKV